jgi:hypothetical protein
MRPGIKVSRDKLYMISQLFWLVPKHVLYWKMSGQIPASEIVEMSLFIGQQVEDTAAQKVHILIDTIGIQALEYSSTEARDAFKILAKKEWMGNVVTIIRDYQIQVHLNMLSSAFGLKWYNVNSMDDAIRTLKKNDNLLQTIPKLLQTSLITRPR